MDINKHSAEFYTKMDELYTEVENDEASGLIHRFDGINVNAHFPSGPGRAQEERIVELNLVLKLHAKRLPLQRKGVKTSP